MAQGIVGVTRVEVTPTEDATWRDVDVSAYVPAGTEGVILEVINTSGTERYWGVRKNGSTDQDYAVMEDTSWTVCAIGLDASRIFDARVNSSDVDIYLVGYIPDGAGAFLTNHIAKTAGSSGEYLDVDISGDTGGDTAKIAFLFFACFGASSLSASLRENGSTDDFYVVGQDVFLSDLRGAMMSCDASQVFEQKVEGTNLYLYLIGWINATYAGSLVNATDHSTGTTGSYVDATLSGIASGSNGAFLYGHGGGTEYAHGIRKNGLDHDTYYDISDFQYLWCAVDVDKKIEQKVENLAEDLWLWGWVTEPAVAGWTHKYLGVANASIGKISGVAIANIVKVDGVA